MGKLDVSLVEFGCLSEAESGRRQILFTGDLVQNYQVNCDLYRTKYILKLREFFFT